MFQNDGILQLKSDKTKSDDKSKTESKKKPIIELSQIVVKFD